MISLDSPPGNVNARVISTRWWGWGGRGVVVLLWVMLCKYDTRPPACHTSIHIPHLQIAPYSQSHPFPYTSIHIWIWICRNIDIFLKFTKETFSCHGTLLSHWKYCWCDPCEWRYPLILTWTTQRLPEAEGRGRSMWRVLQGRSRVLVAASAWWARVTFVLLSELDGLPVGFLNLVEHLQQESVVTIARHPFWRQNLNQTKNISGAQELTPFHFRGPSPFGGKLFPWEILDWAGFRNQLMLMHPELGERHNLYCFKS